MKRCVAFFLIAVQLITLTGCWDMIELEELGYVITIGIDKGESGGYKVTFGIQNPQVGSTDIGKAENEPAVEEITIEVPDIISAQDTALANFTRRLKFSHTKALIVSEELARSEDFFNIVGDLLRGRQLRSDVNLIITKEKAEEFIRSNKPPMETRIHKFYDLMTLRWKETGMSPKSTMHRFINRTESDEGLFLGLYATAKGKQNLKYGYEDQYLPGQINLDAPNPLQIVGSAVFKEGKMIGTLNGEETRIAMNLRPGFKFKGIVGYIKDPLDGHYWLTVYVYKDKDPKVNINIDGGKTKIDATVDLEMEVVNIPSHIDYVEDLNKQDILRKHIEKSLGEKASGLIGRTQSEFKGEPFLWYEYARKKFFDYDSYKKYDWMKSYSEADINVKYNVKLRSFGKELKPILMEGIKD